MNLKDWRKEIDSIDAQLVALLIERASLARKIGALKASAGLPVVDAAREEEILRHAARRGKGVLKPEAIVRIFRAVICESRSVQVEAQSKTGERVL